jgi:hypothetical protein
MSIPDNELDLDKLFLPAWAQEPASANLYAKYEGEERPRDRDRRGPRGPRPGGPRRDRPPEGRGDRGPRRDGGPGGPARRPDQRPGEFSGGNRGPAGERGRGPGGDRGRGPRGRFNQDRERREPPPPLPEIALSLLADDKGVDSLARQIKMTGRAYPLFEIAQMILQRPERIVATFGIRKNAEGQPIQPLFVCALDDTLWLSDDEVVQHVLQKHFGTFYQAERTPTEPPKGKYTFVAQCGMSGVILGPPNYHDYQNQLRKLHTERFSRMPFEAFKARVKIVRDEEVVKKWVEEQSFKTEYICLNLPEPLRLPTMEAVEKHFRETHKENIVRKVESHTLGGMAARSLRSPELVRLVRTIWEDQKRFPLQVATSLSQQFASRGLQFFKVNKTFTHVSVARPHYLDLEATPVSEGIKQIVQFINGRPKSTRRHLIDALAPTPTPAVIPVQPAPEPTAEQAPAATPAAPEPTPEQTALIADLHWLIHQGHVIEFANGILETAKKPIPKPPKPEKKAAATTTQSAAPARAPEAAGGSQPTEAAAPAVASPEAAAPAEAATQPETSESPQPAASEASTVEAEDAVTDFSPPPSPDFHETAEAPAAEKPAENPHVESPS